MAGGVSRTFGVLFLLVGVLLIVGGLVAIAGGYLKEQEEKEEKPDILRSEQEKEENYTIMGAGVAGLVVGVVFVIIAVVMFVIGKSRAESALRREIREGHLRAAPVAPPPPPHGRFEPVDGDGGSTGTSGKGSGPSAKTIGAIAVVAILVVAGASFALLGGDGGNGLFSNGDDADEMSHLDTKEWSGRLEGGVKGPVQTASVPTSRVARDFASPTTTEQVSVALHWTPSEGGATTLSVSLAVVTSDGTETVAETSGKAPLTLSAKVPMGAKVKVSVGQVEDGLVAGQDFRVAVAFYGSAGAA